MVKRIPLVLLLVIQALGGGVIALAHARDVVAVPHIEATHDARCAILHDELRCALCHYAGTRVVTQQIVTLEIRAETVRFALIEPIISAGSVTRLTTPARAPPTALS